MSSAQPDQIIRDYLATRGGSAAAGDVVAHASRLGIAASTLRRVADRVVVKTRTGNRFIWALPASQAVVVAEPDAAEDEPDIKELRREAKALGIEFDGETTEVELQVLVEHAQAGRDGSAERTAPESSRKARRPGWR